MQRARPRCPGQRWRVDHARLAIAPLGSLSTPFETDACAPASTICVSGLTINGDVLSWSHDGSPRSVALTPP
jgi:hypothetical protein